MLPALLFLIGCSDSINSTGSSLTLSPARMPAAFYGQIQITGKFNPIAIREVGCGSSGFLIETEHDIYASGITATGKETFLLCSGQLQLTSRALSCGVTAEAQRQLTPGATYDVHIEGENGSRYFIPQAFTVGDITSDSETDTAPPPDTGNDTGSHTATDTGNQAATDTGSTSDSVPDTDTMVDSDTTSVVSTDNVDSDTTSVVSTDNVDSDTTPVVSTDNVDSDTTSVVSTDNVDSGTATEFSTDDSDYAVQATYTGRTPDFNGQLETLWTLNETLDNEEGCDPGQIPDTIRFEILWDETGLYFGIAVPDDIQINAPGIAADLRDFDAITVFIDVPPTNSAYNQNDNWFIFGPDGKAIQMRMDVPLLGWNVASNASGYSLELGIPWSSLDVTPERGLSLNFDIVVHDIDQASDHCFAFYRANEQGEITTNQFAMLVLD